jgi:hypothetical protein
MVDGKAAEISLPLPDKLTSAVVHASTELRRMIDAGALSTPRWEEAISAFLERLLAVKSHPVAAFYAHWLLPERTFPVVGRVTSRAQLTALTAFLALILLLIVENEVRRRPPGLFFRAGYARYRPVSVTGARLRPTGRLFFRTKRALSEPCHLNQPVRLNP